MCEAEDKSSAFIRLCAMMTMAGFSKVNPIIFLVIVSTYRCTDANILDLFRTNCPYSDFCVTERLLDINTTSCCSKCFCDVACYEFKDCCPDIDQLVPRPTDLIEAECVSVIAKTPYAVSGAVYNSDFMPHYRMLDLCPRGYDDDGGTVNKCKEKEPKSYDDVVMVSALDSRLYKNKHCALCHGVTETIRWKLEIHWCRKDLANIRVLASIAMAYVLKNCLLMSVPPANATFTYNNYKDSCRNNLISSCPSKETSSYIPQDMIDGCENGTHMPFSGRSPYPMLFKNVLCYTCQNYTLSDVERCDIDDIYNKGVSGHFTKLLKMTDAFQIDATRSECREWEIMDYHRNACRDMNCPSYESVWYGTCRPLFDTIYVAIRFVIIYWTPENITMIDPVQSYNDTLCNYYSRKLRDMFRGLECDEITLSVYLFWRKDTHKLVHIEVTVDIGTDVNCTMKDVNALVRNVSFSRADNWVINDGFVEMKGHFSFFRSDSKTDPTLSYSSLAQSGDGFKQSPRGVVFSVCPYVLLNLTEYNMFKAELDDPGPDLVDLSVYTETIRDAYVFSDQDIAVCVDRYLPDRNKASGPSSHFQSLLTILLAASALWIREMPL